VRSMNPDPTFAFGVLLRLTSTAEGGRRAPVLGGSAAEVRFKYRPDWGLRGMVPPEQAGAPVLGFDRTPVHPGDTVRAVIVPLFPIVVDPSTAMRVGGFSGYTKMPLVQFTVPDGGSTLIPLVVGTASFAHDLGYAVPPGEWALTVDLSLGDGRKVRTPAMAFLIIS
jgi:hypothetical protein